MEYYDLNLEDAGKVASQVKISHPYGCAGFDPYGSLSPESIIAASKSIRTFTEQDYDKSVLDRVKDEIGASQNVFFLGFGFHEQNVEYLKINHKEYNTTQVICTAYKTTADEKNSIASLIRTITSNNYLDIGHDRGIIFSDEGCFSIFKDNPTRIANM
jgi:hypothetical protein